MSRSIPKPVQLPSGSWRVRITIDGKRISFTEESKELALAKAITYQHRQIIAPESKTLGEVIDEYIDLRRAVLSPSTVLAYESYRSHRFQAYMKKKISDLDRRTLQRMVNDEARQVSPKTVKNAWGLLTAALQEYRIDVSGINLPQIPRNERPYLTHTEILTFCRAVSGRSCEIPALLALCSLRRSEIAALTWDDVDLARDTIRIRGSVVKGPDGFVRKKTNKTASSARTVRIIIPQLHDALAAVTDKTGPVLKGYPNTMYSQINKTCRDASLPEVGVHGLRHSFASLCHHLGVPEMECAKMGGWSDLSTMRKIYTHIAEDDIAAAESALSHFFDGT